MKTRIRRKTRKNKSKRKSRRNSKRMRGGVVPQQLDELLITELSTRQIHNLHVAYGKAEETIFVQKWLGIICTHVKDILQLLLDSEPAERTSISYKIWVKLTEPIGYIEQFHKEFCESPKNENGKILLQMDPRFYLYTIGSATDMAKYLRVCILFSKVSGSGDNGLEKVWDLGIPQEITGPQGSIPANQASAEVQSYLDKLHVGAVIRMWKDATHESPYTNENPKSRQRPNS